MSEKITITADEPSPEHVARWLELHTNVGTVVWEREDGTKGAISWDKGPSCPYDFSHTRHWCGYDGCRDG